MMNDCLLLLIRGVVLKFEMLLQYEIQISRAGK